LRREVTRRDKQKPMPSTASNSKDTSKKTCRGIGYWHVQR
jgi:hypothetical protein